MADGDPLAQMPPAPAPAPATPHRWTKFGSFPAFRAEGTSDALASSRPSSRGSSVEFDVTLSGSGTGTGTGTSSHAGSPGSLNGGDYSQSDGEYSANDWAATTCHTPASHRFVVELPQSTLTNPRSLYEGFVAPAPVARESEAVEALLELCGHQGSDEYVEFSLSNFTIYVDAAIYPCEMRPLHHLSTRAASNKFYFDGVLSVGQTQFFVKKVPFRELPIGNYDDDEATNHTVGDQIWIRSDLNQKKEIYYRLETPSIEYIRFFHPFVWIADLAKHVIDYCSHHGKSRRQIGLHHFKDQFGKFLCGRHATSEVFRQWYKANGSHDFRAPLAATIDFIWKEAVGVLGKQAASRHHFWSEIKGGYYKPMCGSIVPTPLDKDVEGEDSSTETPQKSTPHRSKPRLHAGADIPQTVVTPYIYDLFGHMGFDNIMKSTAPSEDVQRAQREQIRQTSSVLQTSHWGATQSRHEGLVASIQVGDVISTPPDEEETGTEWKRETSKHDKDLEHVWYGLVQQVHASGRKRSFDVIWMYQPRDTPCGLMKYPWSNELFLSNSCTCDTARVDENDVLATHRVAWFGQPVTDGSAEFFVRQTYNALENCWVSLQENHLTCAHRKDTGTEPEYSSGQTVLANMPNSSRLDVFVVESIHTKSRKRWARLRRLLRRNEEETGTFPPNELVYSEQFVEADLETIVRRCLVRAFLPDEKVPVPFNRNGTGDVFFLTHRQELDAEEVRYVPVRDLRALQFRQSRDLSRIPARRKLRGLDLFCGGGNFGRGIEDGGAVRMSWANDLSPNALHTYMANCNAKTCKPYLGSIDDLLQQALKGNNQMPRPGQVQFISGGSPCQGFSRLTAKEDLKSKHQEKNRSLVASFASFVDLFRPQYGLLENVHSIVKSQGNREECFFSQLICAIVGLGYQVRIIYADAWSYGSPQSRERVFLSFAAPGVTMPKPPALTHSHPPRINLKGIGLMSNGKPFGKRTTVPTPFKFVSASEAAGDLPDIRDAKADYCVGFPDHRISVGYTVRTRQQLRKIPIQPYGMSFDTCAYGYVDECGKRHPGSLSASDIADFFPSRSDGVASHRTDRGGKGWGRVHPKGLFRTVVTCCGPTDRRTGTVNHWQQPRPLTVLEARRAQGFPDEDIILGKASDQWRIVGNSVARQVALALGLAISEAWLDNLYDEPTKRVAGEASVKEGAFVEEETYLEQDTRVQVGVHAGEEIYAKQEAYVRVEANVEVSAGSQVYEGQEAHQGHLEQEACLENKGFSEEQTWVEPEIFSIEQEPAWDGQETWTSSEWFGQSVWEGPGVTTGDGYEISPPDTGGLTQDAAIAQLPEDSRSETSTTVGIRPRDIFTQDIFSDVPRDSASTRSTSIDVLAGGDPVGVEETRTHKRRSHSTILGGFRNKKPRMADADNLFPLFAED